MRKCDIKHAISLPERFSPFPIVQSHNVFSPHLKITICLERCFFWHEHTYLNNKHVFKLFMCPTIFSLKLNLSKIEDVKGIWKICESIWPSATVQHLQTTHNLRSRSVMIGCRVITFSLVQYSLLTARERGKGTVIKSALKWSCDREHSYFFLKYK